MTTRRSKKEKTNPVLAALRRAFEAALAEARANGTPCYVWEDGKIIDIAQRKTAQAKPEKPKAAKPKAKSRRAKRSP